MLYTNNFLLNVARYGSLWVVKVSSETWWGLTWAQWDSCEVSHVKRGSMRLGGGRGESLGFSVGQCGLLGSVGIIGFK